MSQSDEQDQYEEEIPAPPPRTGPLVRPAYIVMALVLVLGVGGLALTGPACNTKEPGRDLKDLTRQQITEQAVNRLKDIRSVLTFTDTTRVMAKPTPIDPRSSGLVVNSVLAVMKINETIDIVTHHAGNGFTAYKLRLPDGACGYVFSTDPIRVH